MSALPRRKACILCAESKRKCDKQLPECQRCLDRDVNCVYPQRKKRRRDYITRDNWPEEPTALEDYANTNTLGNDLGFADWGALGNSELDVPLSETLVSYIPTLPVSESVGNPLAQEGLLESATISSLLNPWFLQGETWVMQHIDDKADCQTNVDLEAFIRAVDQMLQCWVKNGYNSFIHRQLYEKGMPTCIQDAFTTLAAYIARTPAVKETILHIADERSHALVRQQPPAAVGSQAVLFHLSRVQALFIYQFIRLFDGSVRLRASAEQQLPTLRLWTIHLWEATRRYQGEDAFLDHDPVQWSATEYDREYNASMRSWKLWILTESVRRTHILVNTIANVYQTMTKGWTECSGAVMLTARRGLWEAKSAMEWFELSSAKSPLLVPSLQPEPLISQHVADEVDDFVKLLWKFLVGADRMHYWLYKSNKASRGDLL